MGGLVVLLVLLVLGYATGPKKPATTDTASGPTPAPAASTAPTSPDVVPSAAELMANANDTSRATADRLKQLRLLDEKYPGKAEATEAVTLRSKLEKQLDAELNPVGLQWSYGAQQDGMSSKSIHTASVTSTNSFNFDFPYEGRQKARLLIRRHPRWGNDIMISIEKGQMLCSSYGGCPIRIRFDDEKARTFNGNEPSDNSSEMVFIPGYDNFTRKLATAKRLRIEFNVYQQGAVVADFDVSGFDSKRLKP